MVLIGIVFLLLASYTSSLHTWWDQRREIQAQKAEIVMRTEQIAELEDQKDRWNDPAFVKAEARKRFGWVLPGEVGYRVIGSDGTVAGDVPTLDAPVSPEPREWYETLWGSIKQAGRDPVEVAREREIPDEPLEQQ